MISITGRSPVTAEPKAAPASASSEIGVSKTRSAPYFSYRPAVVGEDAAGDRDVLAEEDHALVARQLLVERVADGGAESISVIAAPLQRARASGCSSSSRSRDEETRRRRRRRRRGGRSTG